MRWMASRARHGLGIESLREEVSSRDILENRKQIFLKARVICT